MKKIIYTCDYCGKTIEGDVYTFRCAKRLKDGMDFGLSRVLGGWDPDLCPECLPEWIQRVSPEKKEEKKYGKKQPIDMGKVLALRNAGWTLKRIADEMKVSPQTIANRLAVADAPPEEEQDA